MQWSRTSLLEVDGNVLATLWPPERIVLGLRVSRSLRSALLEHVRRLVLWRSPKTGGKEYLELSAWNIQSCLSRFQGDILELDVTVKKSRRFMSAFLPALNAVLASGQCASLVQLDLTGNKLTGDDEEARLDVLEQCTSLQTLKLANNKLSFVSYDNSFLSGLKMCTALTHLDLRQNKLNDGGLDKLTAVLMVTCEKLQHLDLSWNNLSSSGVKSMSTVLSVCEGLKELLLDGNELDEDAVAHILKNLRSLTALSVSETNVRAVDLALHPAPSLLKLDFSFCDLSEGGALALPSILSCCPALTHLSLNGCRMGSVSRLPDNPSWMPGGGHVPLRVLEVDDNKLGREGARELCEALAGCPALTRLSARKNAMGDEGALGLRAALPALTALAELELANNVMSTRGAVALAEGLEQCSRLERLDLQGNHVGLAGLEALGAATRGGSCLAGLELGSVQLKPLAGTSEAGMQAQYGALVELLEGAGRGLRRLALADNILPVEALPALPPALARCSLLHSLDLSQIRCGPLGLDRLACSLLQLPVLSQLAMCRLPVFAAAEQQEGLEPEAGQHWTARLLRGCASLRDLDLSFAQCFGPPEPLARAVAGMLRESGRLERLSLHACRLTFTPDLLLALPSAAALRDLDLGLNDLSQFDGIGALVRLVEGATALVRLRVQSSLRPEDLPPLAQACSRRDVQLAARPPLLFADSDSDSDQPDSDDD